MADVTPVAGIPFSELGDTPNANALSENMAVVLDHLVLAKHASLAARDVANPAPGIGDTCFRLDTKVHQFYNGADWVDVEFRYDRRTSNQTSTSTTYVNDNQLSLALDQNGVYEFEVNYGYAVNTASDFKYRLTAPAGAAAVCVFNQNFTASDVLGFDFQDTYTLGTTDIVCGGVSGNKIVARSWGIITTSSTAGNLVPQIAVNAGSNTLTLYTGSYMKVRQVG